MDIKTINHFIRLAQIAESIEESSPMAAENIDSFIDEQTPEIEGDINIDSSMFPSVPNESLDGGTSKFDNMALETVNNVMGDPRMDDIMSNFDPEELDGPEFAGLNKIIQDQVSKINM